MSDSTSFSLRSDIATLSAKVDSIETKIDAIPTKQLLGVSPSDEVILSAPTERTTTSDVLQTLKEFIVFLPGLYRIVYEIKATEDYEVHAQIWKNVEAYSDYQSTLLTTYQSKTEDLKFYSADLISLRIKTNVDGHTSYCRNLTARYDIISAIGSVITD